MLAEIDRLIMLINGVYGSRYLKEHKKAGCRQAQGDPDPPGDAVGVDQVPEELHLPGVHLLSQAEIKKPLQLEAKEFEDSVNKVYKQNAKKISTVQYVSQLAHATSTSTSTWPPSASTTRSLHELNKKLNNFLDSEARGLPPLLLRLQRRARLHPGQQRQSLGRADLHEQAVRERGHRADFGPDPRSVTMCGLVSREGETLPFKVPVSIKGDPVEKWMKKVEESMFDAVFRSVKRGLPPPTLTSPDKTGTSSTSAQGLSVISANSPGPCPSRTC
jgi:hypothetical protein